MKLWALSWLAFSLYLLLARGTFYFTDYPPYSNIWQSLFTFSFMIAGLAHVFWLLYGTYHLIERKIFTAKKEYLFYLAIIVISLLTALLFLIEVEGAITYTIMLPFGIKSLIVGLAFTFAGVVTMRMGSRSSAVGKNLLWISFILYGFQNLHYSLACFRMMADPQSVLNVDYTFGVIDFLLLSLIGIGMVIWLLEDERATLEKTNRELDSFLYSTSHDLRAPVASLLGLINIAKHDVKEESGRNYIQMMEDRVKKLDNIFSDILNYSRNIKTEINPTVFRLGQIIDDVIADVKFNQGADSIRLDYDEEITHILRTDYYQLKVVLANLVSNAVKYHDSEKPDQYIAIRFEKIDRNIQISVKDNGKGIARESQRKVFDMFYRATSEADGSGLGLFIVKQALAKINADILLKSEPGIGSTFKVILIGAAVRVD
ncbi:HAMP domain-containing histidine kinase [Marivirga sp. S37H4]|uniref:histidine kinase n=1 Tax=Marivirga aurantiaca TaxID=2802615 RepID=A0A934WZK5_9BACT|nr:HAMP domain-containing histidine kinase [Marivirga aurantiaca]